MEAITRGHCRRELLRKPSDGIEEREGGNEVTEGVSGAKGRLEGIRMTDSIAGATEGSGAYESERLEETNSKGDGKI